MEEIGKLCQTQFGEVTIEEFFNDIMKESEFCSKVIKKEFNKPLVKIKKGHEDFENSTKYWNLLSFKKLENKISK